MTNKKTFHWSYVVIPAVALLVMAVGGWATSLGMDWYNTLNLASITPSGQLIGTVWTFLYIMIAVSAMYYFNNKDIKKDKNHESVLYFFIINVILNVLWSFVFFTWQQIAWAMIEMLVMFATIIILIVLMWKKAKLSSILLIPYAFWVGFATYLTYLTWALNK